METTCSGSMRSSAGCRCSAGVSLYSALGDIFGVCGWTMNVSFCFIVFAWYRMVCGKTNEVDSSALPSPGQFRVFIFIYQVYVFVYCFSFHLCCVVRFFFSFFGSVCFLVFSFTPEYLFIFSAEESRVFAKL